VTVRRSVMLGCGSYLPSRILTNADLARQVDTSDEWIVQRTGIHERHIAASGETTSQMAVQAARAALSHAHVDAQSVDLIVLATSTPDNTFPASAVSVQADLGITHGAAFDLQAVCSGFVFALATADGLLRSGAFSRALVIGAETFSRILDWTDRGTCVLFGDGAGAVVLDAQELPGTREDRGILTVRLRSDGRYKSKLYVDGGPSSTAHHRRLGAQAWHPARQDRHHRRPARQHLGGLDSAGARRCRRRPPHQARRSVAVRGYGRRFHLGRGARALVRAGPAKPVDRWATS
jgi:3-oxoacyl-[acyl-carrier-protein] synthase-3